LIVLAFVSVLAIITRFEGYLLSFSLGLGILFLKKVSKPQRRQKLFGVFVLHFVIVSSILVVEKSAKLKLFFRALRQDL